MIKSYFKNERFTRAHGLVFATIIVGVPLMVWFIGAAILAFPWTIFLFAAAGLSLGLFIYFVKTAKPKPRVYSKRMWE